MAGPGIAEESHMFESPDKLLAKLDRILEKKKPAIIALAEPFADLWGACKLLVAQAVQKHNPAKLGNVPLEKLVNAVMADVGPDRFLSSARAMYEILEPEEREKFLAGMRRHILDELGTPYPITLDELWLLADEYLPLSTELHDDHVEDFGRALRRRFRRLRFSKKVSVASSDKSLQSDSPPTEIVWSNEWLMIQVTFRRSIRRSHVQDFAPPKKFELVNGFTRVVGWVTARGIRSLASEVRRIVRAVLWAAVDLDTPCAPGKIPQLPPISHSGLWSHRDLIGEMIGFYFLPVKVKDESLARLRTATHLMVEGADQPHDAIALVLYCSARRETASEAELHDAV